MKTLHIASVIVLLFVPGSCTTAQEIIKALSEQTSLRERWAWAQEQVDQSKFDTGGWIAYSIERMMGENSMIGSFSTIPERNRPTLYELITGIRIQDPVDEMRKRTSQVLSRSDRKQEERQVLREVAFMFRFSRRSNVEEHLEEIRPTNVNLRVDLQDLPLVWLGKADREESLEFLKGLYGSSATGKQKRRILMACGMHQTPAAFDFMKSIVEGDDEKGVRSEAVFWMGQQNFAGALQYLTSVVKNDESQEVAEKAVFAISQIKDEKATDVLIDLGKNASSRNLRKKAVFWLGQRASKKATESLRDFVYKGDDIEVQKQAVFALTQTDGFEGVTEIIRIAKTHPHPAIRKQAIFWLGQSDDPRAFDAIVEIAKGSK